ncbi:ABC transporter permease [Rossellomorea marisflavi]|uniref:ABC transporter permease n=1 Tax=Rossellomorea marisflavi TaxID=189381 RepID=UPI00201D90D4|nr:ABC transporter permease [Rossellomorea marisflavi]
MMNNVNGIWKQRVTEYTLELQKYLKYMFNDHLLFVLIFAFGGGAYTYNQWVKTLDPSFPAPMIMAVLLGLVLAWSPVYTFLREADAVFLLPLEKKLKGYFTKSLWVSFGFQSYIQLLVLAAMMPMYVAVTGKGFGTFFPLLIIVLAVKWWNLLMRWQILRFQERGVHFTDSFFRFLLSGTIMYLILSGAHLWVIATIAVIQLLYVGYFMQIAKGKNLKWDLLITLEQQRMLVFYRMANMFTDVPKLKGKVHRRKWLDGLLPDTMDQRKSYRYLYIRSLVRTSEYSGLYIRLTLIGAILIYSNPSLIFGPIAGLLFMYLTGFQLIPLFKRFDYKIWVLLYPVPRELKESSFQTVITQTLFIQAFIFSIPLLARGEWMGGVILLAAGCVFSLLFSRHYLVGRLKKMQDPLHS